MNWHWGDLALRLIRAAGALAGAAAGIAALLTQGAFVKRERPLSGWWKDYPLGKYRVTRWGGTLLAVILIAPSIQFVGDWIKDANDTKTLESTAEKIRSDIKDALKAETRHASEEIVKVVQDEANDQLAAQRELMSQQKAISSQTLELQNGTSQILGGMDRSLYPVQGYQVGLLRPD